LTTFIGCLIMRILKYKSWYLNNFRYRQDFWNQPKTACSIRFMQVWLKCQQWAIESISSAAVKELYWTIGIT
jgi:hypothetical protein